MKLFCRYIVIAICYNVGCSLPNRPKNVPSLERYNFFDSELLKAISNRNSKNLVISPVGVKIILGILLEGAHGDTAEEIRNILRLPQDAAQVRKEFDTWLSLVQSVNRHSFLKISNLLLVAKKYSVRRGYQKIIRKHYEGDVALVKFYNRKETYRMINSWVANKTDHLITKMTEENQINSDSQMIFLNTLYFKGLWLNPFEKEKSSPTCFHTLGGCVKTCMLSATGHYKYGYVDQLDASAIQLPYVGSKYFMLILLPNSKENIFAMTRDLIHVNLKSILKEMREEEITIRLPRFEISYSEDLSESLTTLEVTEAFRRDANFSKMFQLESDAPSLSHIFHTAKITVQEGGTVAAAATGASFVPLMGSTVALFNVQHPFLFFIMDFVMNSVILAGRFMHPELTDSLFCTAIKRPPPQVKTKAEEAMMASLKPTLRKITVDTKPSKLSSIIFPKSKANSKPRKPSSTSRNSVSQTKPETTKEVNKVSMFSRNPTPWTDLPAERKQSSHSYSSSPGPSSAQHISTLTSNTTAVTINYQKRNNSSFLTSSTKTKLLSTTSRTPKIPKHNFNAVQIRFPTEKPGIIQESSVPPKPSSQVPNSSEKNVKPILIPAEAPFSFHPFNSTLKEVYAEVGSSTLRTPDPNKVPLTSSFVFRQEELDKRWERLRADFSNRSSWRHRVLHFT